MTIISGWRGEILKDLLLQDQPDSDNQVKFVEGHGVFVVVVGTELAQALFDIPKE